MWFRVVMCLFTCVVKFLFEENEVEERKNKDILMTAMRFRSVIQGVSVIETSFFMPVYTLYFRAEDREISAYVTEAKKELGEYSNDGNVYEYHFLVDAYHDGINKKIWKIVEEEDVQKFIKGYLKCDYS